MLISDAPAAFIRFTSIGMQVEHHAVISESFANLLKDIGNLQLIYNLFPVNLMMQNMKVN